MTIPATWKTILHRPEKGRPAIAIASAFFTVLLALLYMTNHILLFLVIPLAIYFAATGERRRVHLIVFAVEIGRAHV